MFLLPKTNCTHGCRHRGGGGREAVAPLDFQTFIYDTEKVKGGLMVLFIGLDFSIASSPLKIFLPMPLIALVIDFSFTIFELFWAVVEAYQWKILRGEQDKLKR